MLFVDSGSSNHVVHDVNLLFEYEEHDMPIVKYFENLHAIGEGILQIPIHFGKCSHILLLMHIQLVPLLTDDFFSFRAFNIQLNTSVVFNVNNSFI